MDEYLRIRLLGRNKRTSKPGPTYVYLFSHKGQASFTEIFHGGRENFYGKWIWRLHCRLNYNYETCEIKFSISIYVRKVGIKNEIKELSSH